MDFFRLMQDEPRFYWSVIVTGIVSVTLHELGHVFAALREGDDTPRLLGHVTLNPVVHMGWLSIAALFFLGVAWGQTPVQPLNFRSRHGDAIVSWSGPAVNLVLAAIGLLVAGLCIRLGGPVGAISFLRIFGMFNVFLFLLNMIPIPPFDGANVLASLSPGFAQLKRDPGAQTMFLVAFGVIFFFAGTYLFELA